MQNLAELNRTDIEGLEPERKDCSVGVFREQGEIRARVVPMSLAAVGASGDLGGTYLDANRLAMPLPKLWRCSGSWCVELVDPLDLLLGEFGHQVEWRDRDPVGSGCLCRAHALGVRPDLDSTQRPDDLLLLVEV